MQTLNHRNVLKLFETGTLRSSRMEKLVDIVKIRHFSYLGVKKVASSYDVQLLRRTLQHKRSRPVLNGCVEQRTIGKLGRVNIRIDFWDYY